MRRFIFAVVVLFAVMIAPSSWAATATTTAIIYITGTESIPSATITQDITYDESGDMTAKGTKTYPAPSSSNRYTFETVNSALTFAEDPASYIGEQSDTASYDYEPLPKLDPLEIVIEQSSLSSTGDFSASSISNITVTATTAITPPANYRHFIVGGTNVTFSGLTLSGLSDSAPGGGVLVSGGTATFSNVTFRSITAPKTDAGTTESRGGGISVADAGNTVIISGCNFTSCKAHDGGAIYIGTDGVTFSGTNTFTGNTAERYGGAICSNASSVVAMSGLRFNGTNSARNGGAVYIGNGGAAFSSANFSANSATYGGALYAQAGTISLTGTTFTANSADRGGAIYSLAATTIGDSVTLNGTNTASYGGALYIAGGTTTISGSDTALNENTATSSGGAAYIATGTLAITGSSVTINENTATENGGAIYLASGRFNVTGNSVKVEGNTASYGSGGAIYVAGSGASATIAGGTISIKGNTSPLSDGGGIYATGGGTVNLGGAVTFEDNQAGQESESGSGGAIFLAYNRTGTKLNITSASGDSVAFNNNYAATSGGGIYAGQNAVLTFSASTSFTGNEAQDGNGGALWLYSAAQLPEGTITFTDNKALKSSTISETEGSGGAICIGGLAETSVTLGSTRAYTFSGNTAASYGGAICTVSADIEFSGYTVNTRNTAELGGGFAASYTGRITVSNGSSISNQLTHGYGGAIYARKVVISSSSFGADGANESSSTDDSKGGGAVFSNSELTVTDSDFTGNTSVQGGGAIYAEAASVDITNSYFEGNIASSGNGGAVMLHNFCDTSITSSTFRSNTSSRLNGGGVYAQGRINISLCWFKENISKTSGGAVYFDQNSTRPPYSEFRMSSSTLDENNTSNAEGYGGGLFVAANAVFITSCTFTNNHLFLSGNSGEGGGVYLSTIERQTENNQIQNCTFYENSIYDGPDETSGGGGLAVHCEGTTEVTSCTFVGNDSKSKGGAIYVGENSKLQLSGTITVGNIGSGVYDVWSDGSISSGGYNRIGVYGTGSGVTNFYSDARNDTDRTSYPSKGWTRATFFGNNSLADNIRSDLGSNIPPYIGSEIGGQIRLQTIMLSEDGALPLEDTAVNIIPYSRRTSFPDTDQRGVSRVSSGLNLDVGAVFYDGNRPSDTDTKAVYTISSVKISGVPSNLKRLGQSASLIAQVTYTNRTKVLGGNGEGEEPVTWTSDKPAIIRINAKTGDVTVLGYTPGNTYVTITVTTDRTDLSGKQASDSVAIHVTEPDYSLLNTDPTVIDYINSYLQRQVPDYDITLKISESDSSAVSSSTFQSSFAATWNGATATMASNLTDSSVQAGTANSYTPSGGYKTLKDSGVGIRVNDRSNGEIIPLTYAWTFTGDEVKSLMGYDMAETEINDLFADSLFSRMRIDFVGKNNIWTVIGSGGVGAAGSDSPGVSASGAMSANALTLSKADNGKGLNVELTAYIANVDASQNNGPKLVQSSNGELLVVPDGVGDDGQIYGTMWITGKTSESSSTDTSTSTNTNSNTTNSNGNTSSSSSGGGGGCESFGMILPAIALMFILKRK